MKIKRRFLAVAWLLLATVMGGHAASYVITNTPGWNLIANQLNGANGNGISVILPPSSVPAGSRLYKFNLATKSFNPVEVRTISTAGAPIWSPGTNVLNPGDGLMFSNASPSTLNLTLSGNPNVPALPINIGSGLVLVARQTNDIANPTNILGYAPKDYTVVYRFNPGAGRDPNNFAPPHYTLYTVLGGVWRPSVPVIAVGESVWISTNGGPPVITFLSSNQVVCPGTTAFMSVGATGTLPLSYQWYYGSTAVSGATNNFYSFTANAGNLGNYRVVVSNVFGAATSGLVNVSFLLPQVTGPSNTLACLGGSATFVVEGGPVGAGYTYKWYKKGVLQPNATGNTFTVSPVTADDYVDYCVVVTGCTSITNCATLSPGDPDPPVIRCPPDQTVIASGADGARVAFTVYATDQCDPNPEVVAMPASGSLFPIGTTEVKCTARDSSGNRSTCTFNVIVLPPGCCEGKGWRMGAEGGPGSRMLHAMAYDAHRQRVVLFGGAGETMRGDTWEWDGTEWSLVATQGPGPRVGMAMAYDASRQVTVLFGGADGKAALGDTWEWDGVMWRPRELPGPPGRAYHVMAYDIERRVTVLFGGVDADVKLLGDVWEYDGDKWIERPGGKPSPEPRYGAAMAYGAGSKQMILFGGRGQEDYLWDTWQWDGQKWTLLADSGPPARAFHAMAYDDNCDRIVLHGGEWWDGVFRSDTLEWDGSQWTEKNTGTPSARSRHAMAHDSARSKTVLFGGYGPQNHIYGDTWLREPGSSPAQIRSAYAICGENTITIAFSKPLDPASALDTANYQLQCDGVMVPIAGISLNADARLVTLTLAPPATISSGCVLYVENIRDQCGGLLRAGQFGIECDRDPCAKGSGGTEFWLTFPGNYAPDRTNQPIVRLWISGVPGTIGSVSMPGWTNPFLASFTIPANGVSVVALPRAADLGNSNDEIQSKGIHVVASGRVNVYGYNHIRYTTDAFLGLSTAVLGKIYMVMAYRNQFNSVPELNGSQFAIVATADNTKVVIVPSAEAGSHPVGVPYLITLMRGQTYQLRTTNAAPADLTGTIIVADQPIAVFAGHQCANLPSANTFFCNYLVEQMFPAHMAGTDFLTFPLATRSGDTFRFLALYNNTTVSVNGAPLSGVLNQGQHREVHLSAGARITADKPIFVAQYANSSDYDLVQESDPFMVMIPPTALYASSYTVRAPTADFPRNYVNVIVPSGSVGSVTLDGASLPGSLFSPIGASGYSGAQVQVGPGSHTLDNPVPFGVVVYGWAEYDAYGYPGGTCISKEQVNPPRFICPPESVVLEAGAGCVAPVPDLVSQVGNIGQAVYASQSPAAGTPLAPGSYVVTIVVVDRFGNQTVCNTALIIQPSKNPGLQCPQNIIANCTSSNGAVIYYTVTLCNTNFQVTAEPPSGSLFPVGTTVVTVKALQDGRVVETCTFTVTIRCGGGTGAPLGIASGANQNTVRLTWEQGYQLQKANTVDGPWITISNVTSGASLPLSGKQGFFRLYRD